MKMRKQNIHGFTLIELLVVVAIISVLIAMLMPALSSARKKAKESVCLSNLHEIGIAISMYENDFNDFLPARATDYEHSFWMITTWGTHTGPTHLGLLKQCHYLETGDVFFCTDGKYGSYIPIYSKYNFTHYTWGTGAVVSTYAMRYSDLYAFPKLQNLGNVPYVACCRYTEDDPAYGIDLLYRMNPHDGKGVNVWWTDGSAKWFANAYPYNNIWWSDTRAGRFWDKAEHAH
jgi:prepilin-type N-terminal cleavage/methylation domain-containing protein/prepilin-type processing-associated H-X9-DG protein